MIYKVYLYAYADEEWEKDKDDFRGNPAVTVEVVGNLLWAVTKRAASLTERTLEKIADGESIKVAENMDRIND